MSHVLTLRRSLTAVLLLAVLLGAALFVPALQVRTVVRLAVDGALERVETDAVTVGEVLATEGVEYAAGDRVLPAPEVPVQEGTLIRVLRSIEVELDVDGEVSAHRGTFRTVQGALTAAGVEVADDQLVEPAPRTRLQGGERVVVRSPKDVTIIADGEETTVTTHLDAVGRLLEAQAVELGEDDRVSSDLTRRLEDGLRVRVRRVEVEREVVEQTFSHDTRTRRTDALLVGRERVVQEGRDARVRSVLETTYVDGELESRERVEREVLVSRRARIVEEGTREPAPEPAPAPAPSTPARSGSSSSSTADDGSVWHRLARCESGGRWGIDGRYDGGLQFHPDTWTAWKPAGAPRYAHQASPDVQIEAGRRLQAARGWGQWPSCARKLGLL